MTDSPTAASSAGPPSTAVVQGVLAEAAEVLIIEASGYELDRADAARVVVSGDQLTELATLLAVVDGGTGDRCRCLGSPTLLVMDASGRELARWTLHHQTHLGGVGSCDAQLRDGPALTDWLAGLGLTRSREVQLMLARQAAQGERRREQWVKAAPAALTQAAQAASLWETDAEETLAGLVAQLYPDPRERIHTLLAWAGFPPRHTTTDGTPWYELAPQRLLLAEPAEAILAALTSATLTAEQLDGAAELFTSLEWTSSAPADLPQPLRSLLIEHVTTTGTGPMKFRMRHGYGAS
ncbi:hypothetical protein Rhe02_02380 [Rhizocola hellebori]|uniref:Uncharacterized protein n=1 Tax=Rhizocola hellebori TaxID=1392758 RepID=A0A8J3VD51_9ACTN|nr:hypothetical protein [Rhizocola hellebori]GIH02171.1 hypothetical protein Rhe02_02380 [Rhizocola hellebori]